MSKPSVLVQRPVRGVAIDQGSGLGAALREARGAAARDDDLLTFKRLVVETLSPLASTMLIDATYGARLLEHIDRQCEPMLAYEADVYRIADDDRMTVMPDNLAVTDYAGLGVRMLKFFLYFCPHDEPAINERKFARVRSIARQCDANNLVFLFEPLVYDRAIPDQTSVEFARAKPGLVEQSTRIFARPEFGIDILKVEVPVNLDHVEGYSSAPAMSQAEARACFRHSAEAAGDIPILYLSAGVTFDRFETGLRIAREAGVSAAGFMCGRAIWSDAIAAFGAEGPAAAARWLAGEGRRRLQRLSEVFA